MSIRKDYTIDVLRLLDGLQKEIDGKRTLLGVMFGVNKEELVMQIEKIRANMPREMKDAAQLAHESERIVRTAQEEATATLANAQTKAEDMIAEAEAKARNILEQARLKQEEMVDENEVLRIASTQAAELRNDTERECRELRREADKYAYDVLVKLERNVSHVLTQVESGRQQLEPTEAPVRALVEPKQPTRV